MKTVIPQGTRKGSGHYVPGVISNGMLYISGSFRLTRKQARCRKAG